MFVIIINRLFILKGPTRVAIGSSVESKFEENYFFSDGNNYFSSLSIMQSSKKNFLTVKIEPGYYKAGDFGVRIESILRVVNTTFKVISF